MSAYLTPVGSSQHWQIFSNFLNFQVKRIGWVLNLTKRCENSGIELNEKNKQQRLSLFKCFYCQHKISSPLKNPILNDLPPAHLMPDDVQVCHWRLQSHFQKADAKIIGLIKQYHMGQSAVKKNLITQSRRIFASMQHLQTLPCGPVGGDDTLQTSSLY